MPVRINGSTSGYVELAAPAVAGSTSLTLPATSGNVPVLASGASSGESSSLKISTRPWNMPWGFIASGANSASQLNISTIADVTNVTATFTAVANRRYRVSLRLSFYTSAGTSSATAALHIYNGASSISANQIYCATVDNVYAGYTDYIGTFSAGTQTVYARAQKSSGTGTLNVFYFEPSWQNLIYVEDIGPA